METPAPAQRLQSLDALRGFDMCWILGLQSAILAVLGHFMKGSALHRFLDWQFEHVDWAGFTFEDMIFPLFLFIAGVSMALALPRRLERDGVKGATLHLLERGFVLVFLGVIYSHGIAEGWDKVRWLGVLQRIGLASMFAGLLFLVMKERGLAITAVAILIGYWLLLALVPMPGCGAGDYAEGHNLTNYLDKLYLPGRKYDGDHDPEGILSTLPAIATAILGLLAGQWLKRDMAGGKKVLGLVIAGAALFALGWAWHPFFPVVKKLWSSSFVCVAGGLSLMLLGAFYWMVDIQGWRSWCTPFFWVGANPIALYLASGFGFFKTINERLVGHPHGDWKWLPNVTLFLLMLATAWWLHRRKIYIKV